MFEPRASISSRGLSGTLAPVFGALIFLVVLGLFSSPSIGQEAGEETNKQHANTVKDFVENNCLDCHRSKDPEGDFDLESLDFSSKQFGTAEFKNEPWEKMWRRLASRQMPPHAAVRPDEEEYLETVNGIDGF